MLRAIIYLIFAGLIFKASAFAQLPPEAKAKLLDREIVAAIKENELSKADDLISEYQSLGVDVPPTYLFIQGKIANANGNYLTAKNALENYFNATSTNHAKYEEALTLYQEIEPKVKAEQKRQAIITKIEQDRKNEESRKLAEIERQKQEELDRGRKRFNDAYRSLERLVENVDFDYSARGKGRYDHEGYLDQNSKNTHTHKVSFSMKQYLSSPDANLCSFKYSRNVFKSNAEPVPSKKNNTFNLYGSGKRLNSFSYRKDDWKIYVSGGSDIYISSVKVADMYFKTQSDANKAIGLLRQMQQGCDIVNGRVRTQTSKFVVQPSVPPKLVPSPSPDAQVRWYQRECDKGVMEKCHGYAMVLERGNLGVSMDLDKAKVLYEKACTGGYLDSCNSLARFYFEGKGGVAPDNEKAVDLLTKSCDLGGLHSCNVLGQRYVDEENLPFDISKGKYYLSIACTGNTSGASYYACRELRSINEK